MMIGRLVGDKNGGGEIRTHETLAGLPVFKTGAFGRSATPPGCTIEFISTAQYGQKAEFAPAEKSRASHPIPFVQFRLKLPFRFQPVSQ